MIFIKFLHKYLLLLIPLFLISGPFLPDLALSLSSILFLFLTIKERNYFYFKNIFFIVFIIWCVYCILISFFSFNISISLNSSLFHFRFGFFALSIWYALNEYNNFTKSLFMVLLFSFVLIIFDGFFQYFNGQNFLRYKYN